MPVTASILCVSCTRQRQRQRPTKLFSRFCTCDFSGIVMINCRKNKISIWQTIQLRERGGSVHSQKWSHALRQWKCFCKIPQKYSIGLCDASTADCVYSKFVFVLVLTFGVCIEICTVIFEEAMGFNKKNHDNDDDDDFATNKVEERRRERDLMQHSQYHCDYGKPFPSPQSS